MGFKLAGAKALSAVSTGVLKHIFKRPAANFPGKIALYVDPHLVADLSQKLSCGSVLVCGTNGKTTVTNLLADALEAAGMSVICNRGGANLDSGIATALLHTASSDWGVFESDELWVAKVLPQLKSKYLLLLNLFRDQLDRVGEINSIQESIVSALISSPGTTLVYNADDPFCAAIATKVSNATLTFGIEGSIEGTQAAVDEAQMCQMCSGMLAYGYRHYGQLGQYYCESCGFSRKPLDFFAHEVRPSERGLSLSIDTPDGASCFLETSYNGIYMIYNLLAAFMLAHLLGCSNEAFQKTLDAFDPQNGRLQRLILGGHSILINLAKNPTGFNQNIKLIMQEERSASDLAVGDSDQKSTSEKTLKKAVAFFVNDKEGDGRDVSWLWDIDFEELATLEGLKVFVGGIRRNDLQLCLKYAGIEAELVEKADDVLTSMSALSSQSRLYFIANYTALPPICEELTYRAKVTLSGTEA